MSQEWSSLDRATQLAIKAQIPPKTPEELTEELTSKKDILELRIKSIEKQEQVIRKKADSIQKEVLEEIKKTS